MTKIEKENLQTIVTEYLLPKDIILYSAINKNTYTITLNPTLNPILNTQFRKFTLKQFYFDDLLDEEYKIIKENEDEDLLDDYKITGNNWKKIYIDLTKNYASNNKKEYVKVVYESFMRHIYLLNIRKKFKYLEYINSTYHHYYFYDFCRNKIVYHYYDKKLNDDGFVKQEPKRFLLKSGLLFENDFLNFNDLVKSVKEDKNAIIILEKIINYDYLGLDNLLMCENNSVNISIKNNDVLNSVVWLNHTALEFAKMLNNYMKLYCNPKASKKAKLIIEYYFHHNNFINFSLLIDEKFSNLNLIINYLYRFVKDKTKQYCEFSLYKMFFNILKKEIYNKLENNLVNQFEILATQYSTKLFDSNNFEKNERRGSFESKTKDNSESSEENDEELEMKILNFSFEKNNDNKLQEPKINIIENFMNCMTDLSINEKNALCINYSLLTLDDNYDKYENILINTFVKNIELCLEKDIKYIFNIIDIIQDLLSIKEESREILNVKSNGFKFIRRTKRNMLNKIKESLQKNLKNFIIKNYSDFAITSNKKKLLIQKNIYNNNNNINSLIDEFNNEEKINIQKIYEEFIDEIKNELLNYSNTSNNNSMIVYNDATINDYFENYASNYFVIFKDILYSYYYEKKLYMNLDNRILAILKANNKSNSIR